MLNLIPLPYRIAAAALLAVLIFTVGWKVNGWRWESAVADQQAEAARTLQDETEKVLAHERRQAAIAEELERAYVERSDERTRALEENRRLSADFVSAADRLRVPGRGRGGGAAEGRAGAPACRCDQLQAANDQLSGALGQLAEAGNQLAQDADREADVARTCTAWAMREGRP